MGPRGDILREACSDVITTLSAKTFCRALCTPLSRSIPHVDCSPCSHRTSPSPIGWQLARRLVVVEPRA